MKALMGFLVIYVRKVHCDRYFVRLLVNNPGSSYLDVVTASDIAYAATLLKNSGEVWSDKVKNDGKVSDASNKTLFTSGKGKKRTLGTSMWSEEGMEFYDRALANWKPCYRKDSPEYKYIRDFWNEWIESDGKDLFVNSDSLRKKSIHSILHTRKKESASKAAAGKKKGTDDPPKKKYSYDTDSDDDLIELGDWNKKTKRGKSNEDDEEEEESGDDNEGAGDEDDGDDDEDEDGVPVLGSSSDEDDSVGAVGAATKKQKARAGTNKKGEYDDDEVDQNKVGKTADVASTTAEKRDIARRKRTASGIHNRGVTTRRNVSKKVVATVSESSRGRSDRNKSKKSDDFEY